MSAEQSSAGAALCPACISGMPAELQAALTYYREGRLGRILELGARWQDLTASARVAAVQSHKARSDEHRRLRIEKAIELKEAKPSLTKFAAARAVEQWCQERKIYKNHAGSPYSEDTILTDVNAAFRRLQKRY